MLQFNLEPVIRTTQCGGDCQCQEFRASGGGVGCATCRHAEHVHFILYGETCLALVLKRHESARDAQGFTRTLAVDLQLFITPAQADNLRLLQLQHVEFTHLGVFAWKVSAGAGVGQVRSLHP